MDTSILTGASDKVTGVTKSVVALAVALKINPSVFCKAWLDEPAQLTFMAELVHELTVRNIAEAQKHDTV